MTRDEILDSIIQTINRGNVPEFDAGDLSEILIEVLSNQEEKLGETTKATLLGVALILRKHYADEMLSAIMTMAMIDRARW